MSMLARRLLLLLVLGGAFLLLFGFGNSPFRSSLAAPKDAKLYWFIADGMRAEEDLFTVYKWAKEGKLPNIKKLMENGAYGYSIPDFPTLTSTNIASLLTGAKPITHGVVEGAMRTEGTPLAKPSINGFSSASKKVAPIWTTLENVGKKVVLLSVPGSTPPELKNGVTIRGRWGNWGLDAPAVIFEPKSNFQMRKETIQDFYFFTLDKNLTRFVDTRPPSGWENAPASFSKAIEARFEAHGGVLFAYIFDTTDDGKINYDQVIFSSDKKTILADLAEGQWSEWVPLVLSFEGKTVDSQAKVRVIKIWEDGRFRIRVLYNTLNQYIVEPQGVATELTKAVGPMVDFLDNCLCLGMAPQLIIEKEDEAVALEEARMSWDWHRKAAGYIVENWKPDAFIQDFYTPNQMLVSRWWMGKVDPQRIGYDPKEAEKAWKDLLELYQGIDSVIGEVMSKADSNTLIVLSAEHGTAPLYKQVRLNNLFAQKGWMKFTIDETNGKPIIDWDNSKVVYLKMAHVYINPNGLGGSWKRASGAEYEQLRNEVIQALEELHDSDGAKPLARAVKWKDAPSAFDLPTDRVGDLVLGANTGYRFWEEPTKDGVIFTTPLATGYKETVNPQDLAVRTPFVIMGPGVKKGYKIEQPISHVDQMPTLLQLLGVEIPQYVQGRVLTEIIK